VHLVMFRIEGQVQDLSLKIKSKVIYGGLFAVLCFVLGSIGFKLLGERIEGVFLGVLIGRVLHVFVFQNLVDKMLMIKAKKKIVLYTYLVVLFFLSKVFMYTNSWFMFIIISFLTGVLLFLICFNLFLSKNSKRKLMEMAGLKNNSLNKS